MDAAGEAGPTVIAHSLGSLPALVVALGLVSPLIGWTLFGLVSFTVLDLWWTYFGYPVIGIIWASPSTRSGYSPMHTRATTAAMSRTASPKRSPASSRRPASESSSWRRSPHSWKPRSARSSWRRRQVLVARTAPAPASPAPEPPRMCPTESKSDTVYAPLSHTPAPTTPAKTARTGGIAAAVVLIACTAACSLPLIIGAGALSGIGAFLAGGPRRAPPRPAGSPRPSPRRRGRRERG